MKKSLAGFFVIFVAMSLIPPASGQGSASTEFDQPVQVFFSSVQGQYIVSASLAVDSHNAVYLAFDVNITQYDTDYGRTIYLARSEDGGATWTVNRVLQGQMRFPRLAVGPQDELYLLYLQGLYCGANGVCDQFHLTHPSVQLIKSVDAGTTFSSPVQISSPGMTAVETGDLAVDSQGQVYLAWSEGNVTFQPTGNGTILLQFRTSSPDGVLSPVQTLATGGFYFDRTTTYQERLSDVHLARTGDGAIHVLFGSSEVGELYYLRFSDTNSIPSPVLVDFNVVLAAAGFSMMGNPTLAGDAAGNAAFTYLTDSCFLNHAAACYTELKLARQTRDSAASTGILVTNYNEDYNTAAVALTPSGTAFVSWTDRSDLPGGHEPALITRVPPNSINLQASQLLSTETADTGTIGTVAADNFGIPIAAWTEVFLTPDRHEQQRLMFRRGTICKDTDGDGNPDSDGDGLCDNWETEGIKDASGNMLLDLPKMAANPRHKDIFVEIDYMDCHVSGSDCADMHSHKPDPNALHTVQAVFAAAPVGNPDSQPGISLHIAEDEEEALPHTQTIDFAPAQSKFNALKLGPEFSLENCDGHFGTPAERDTPNCADRLKARRNVFHYVIFAHNFKEDPLSSGKSETPGNDTIISLGDWNVDDIVVNCLSGETRQQCGERNAEAGTFMHELGHSLGLRHGGGDDLNCKPNYLSVMSYSRQLPDILPFRGLDYSRNEFLPIDENNPDESQGVADAIGGHPGRFVVWGFNGAKVIKFADGALDWDQDGTASGIGSVTDLNFIADTCEADSPGDTPALSVLNGFNDWLNLVYNFRWSTDFNDGAARQTAGDAPELTSDQVLAAAKSVDFDGDGISNADDNCPGTFNPGQEDSVGDGFGDACRSGPPSPVDTIAPTTNATAVPEPNAAGWNNSDVTLALSAADNPSGSGVKQITFSASGAQTVSTNTVSGSSASLLLSTEGQTTITFFATDNAGNAESPHSITVKLDKTAPTIAGTRTPAPNANGWNNTSVTVSFVCADSLSGLAQDSPPLPATLTAEGANQSVVGTCTDFAGNSASAAVGNINIDSTPPVLAVTANPPPNTNGWNNSDVTVTFAAVDALSGVELVSAPVSLTAEGASQIVTGNATDEAGNLAVARAAFNLDKTPPEAFSQFDPVSQELAVFGRDSLSGVPLDALTPISIVPANPDDDEDRASNNENDNNDERAELRTYRILDAAGNSLLLVERVKKEGHEIKARVVSLQYGDGPVLVVPSSKETFEWSLEKDGTLRDLEQSLELRIGTERREFKARFDARKNQTVIEQEDSKPETKIVRPGLVLLRLATGKGALAIEF